MCRRCADRRGDAHGQDLAALTLCWPITAAVASRGCCEDGTLDLWNRSHLTRLPPTRPIRPPTRLPILLGDRHVGRVEWFARSWGRPATSSCWEIAIGVGAEHRGQGIGSTAQDLLARYLFEHTCAERVQASTDVESLAERRALTKAGFQEEGTVRRAQWRADAWHDIVLDSRLRELG